MKTLFPENADEFGFLGLSRIDHNDGQLNEHVKSPVDVWYLLRELELRLGWDNSPVTSSHDFKIAALEALAAIFTLDIDLINSKLRTGTAKGLVSSVPQAGQTIVLANLGISNRSSSSYPALAIADSGGFVAISNKTQTGFDIKPYFDNETVHIVVF